MFLVACIVWVVEFVYDMAFPGKPEEKKKKSILIGKHMIKIEKKIAEGGYADIYRVIADEDDNVHMKQSLNPISALGARKHTISVYDVPLDVYALKRMFFQANSAPKLLSEE